MSKNYKRTMDKCIKNYRNGISRKLSLLRSTNSKEYWKVLNSGDKKSTSAVDINKMHKFMSDVNTSECDDTPTLNHELDAHNVHVADDF